MGLATLCCEHLTLASNLGCCFFLYPFPTSNAMATMFHTHYIEYIIGLVFNLIGSQLAKLPAQIICYSLRRMLATARDTVKTKARASFAVGSM